MIYKCCKCLYLFECGEKADRCPDCGSLNFKPAGFGEQEEYRRLRAEFDIENPIKSGLAEDEIR